MPDTLATGQLLERRNWTLGQLEKAKKQIKNIESLNKFPGLCIYVTGSYARLEAGKHSDIDLFFLHKGSSKKNKCSKLHEFELFSDIIKFGNDMGLGSFSNDGEYLKIQHIDNIIEGLGGPEDDYHNHFTARMLLLLESQPLFNKRIYESVLEKIIEAYFRDYPDHSSDFRPIFLINDILRFWKTLCLNYEHKRNRPNKDPAKKIQQQVKNFKLGYSRMVTCFGTVVALCAQPEPVNQKDVLIILKDTPLDRLFGALNASECLQTLRSQVSDEFAWFLEKTALSTPEIESLFGDKDKKKEMFTRRDAFSGLLFQVLQEVTRENKYMRYLVI